MLTAMAAWTDLRLLILLSMAVLWRARVPVLLRPAGMVMGRVALSPPEHHQCCRHLHHRKLEGQGLRTAASRHCSQHMEALSDTNLPS